MRGGVLSVVFLVVGAFIGVLPAAASDAIDGIRVTRIEPRLVVLNWQPSPRDGDYEVVRDGVVVGTSDDTWFVARDLEPQTTYAFVVRRGDAGETETLTVTTSALVPSQPTVDVWWIGPKGATLSFGFGEFEIRRDGVVVSERSGRVFTDAGLVPETTYVYEVRGIAADGALGPATTLTITTRPLLEQVRGVEVDVVEPGVVDVSWVPLDDPTVRYRIFLDGELVGSPTRAGAASTRVSVPFDANTVIQVGGYNGGGGPLSEPVVVESGPVDDRFVDLRVAYSWPGTVVLRWNPRAAQEDVVFDGEVVAVGRHGWATVTNLRYGAEFDVTIRSSTAPESVVYPITTATIPLRDVRQFTVTAVDASTVRINFRKDPFVDFELYRDGALVATITQVDPVPIIESGLEPGSTYTYSIRQVADGATGTSQLVSQAVTLPLR